MIGAMIDTRNPVVMALMDGFDLCHAGESGRWKARCPAHDDTTASLAVSPADNGGIVMHCHAGCSTESVLRAVGCTMHDLMPPKKRKPRPKIVATYDYRDEAGELVSQAVRMDPKEFRQRRPDGDGWKWSVKGVRIVPYRLPELLAAKAAGGATVYITEGEKDVDRLTAAGLVATCNAGGAEKWRKEHSEHLADCNVVVLADNDDTGRRHANQVAASTKAAGAASIKLVELPGLPLKGDVSDWLNAGHTTDELSQIVEAASEWVAPPKERQPELTAEQLALLSPTITNVRGEEDEREALPMADVLASIDQVTCGWPRRVGTSLFVDDPTHGLHQLGKIDEMFGWLQSKAIVTWHRLTGCCSRGEVFHELQRTAKAYRAIEAFPHFPPFPDHYYAHEEVTPGTGEHLQQLLDKFCPETQIDRDLILALFATAAWGGDGGTRPAFVVVGSGRGIGKTTLIESVGFTFGGMFAISKDDKAADIDKRLLTPRAATKRVVGFDNVKAVRLSWAELEARITAREISGHQMYAGEQTRPNTLVWCVTLNGPSLSKDMSQRSVIIKLKKPSHSGDWEDELFSFIETHRWQIIADLAAFFRERPEPLTKHTRWGKWERDVLARLPEPAEAQRVIAERQGEVDADDEESADIEDHFRQKLQWLGYKPDVESVHIPNTIAREWYCKATGHPISTTGVTRAVKQAADEGTLAKLKVNPGRVSGRGLLWSGGSSTAIAYDLEQRLAKRLQEQQ